MESEINKSENQFSSFGKTKAGKIIYLLIALVVIYLLIKGFFGLIIPVSLGFLAGFLVWIFIQKNKEAHKNAKLLGVTVFIVFGLIEILLRISGIYDCYLEKIGLNFISPYKITDTHYGWLHIWPPNSDATVDHGEFKYRRLTNSEGICDIEHTKEKASDLLRILTLGDSFTEGIGAPEDSSWPHQLQNKLQADSAYQHRIEIINGGVSGSDPFFDYMLLKIKLLNYHPDFVTMSVSKQDFEDYCARGGMERFQSDSTLSFKKPPWYELIFKSSFLCRFFVLTVLQKDFLYLNKIEKEKLFQKYLIDLRSLIYETNKLCKDKHIPFLLIIRVEYWEFYSHYNFALDLNIKDMPQVGLYDYFLQHTDISDIKNRGKYYWIKDGHHNSTGYGIYANGVYDWLKIHPDFLQPTVQQ